ncbi:MAG: YkgJ family cysteine cluster protein [Planctomycetes bacterium]|nr:YkgJ family cysteine cluster protein [Planctomycetota bacterium]
MDSKRQSFKKKRRKSKKGRSFPAYSEHPAVLSRRIYPQEIKYQWLSILLDSYTIDDYERELDVKNGMLKRGENIACHKGCSNCCRIHSIPITKPELSGISWYYSEICESDIRKQIRTRLLNNDKTIECPFLLDDVCSIYPVRPLACRDFFVYGEPCKMNEDPFMTRRKDVHPPNREISRYVALRLLDFQGFNLSSMEEKEKAFNDGIIVSSCRPMHDIDWVEFVRRTDSFF